MTLYMIDFSAGRRPKLVKTDFIHFSFWGKKLMIWERNNNSVILQVRGQWNDCHYQVSKWRSIGGHNIIVTLAAQMSVHFNIVMLKCTDIWAASCPNTLLNAPRYLLIIKNLASLGILWPKRYLSTLNKVILQGGPKKGGKNTITSE